LLDSVEQAVAAAVEIITRLNSANLILPASRELYASVGIGHGNILNIDNEAIFGLQVNLASKLGEDLAETGEILLTDNAYKEIEKNADIKSEKRQVIVSGVEVSYYAIVE
jgi:adenylate cyclase